MWDANKIPILAVRMQLLTYVNLKLFIHSFYQH